MSQQAFADDLNVTYSTVNRWENGKTMPCLGVMKSIKEFCKWNALEFSVIEKEWMEF